MAGLDIGQCINGFVYHTKYDRIDVIPRAALQNTGDNLLGLVRTLSQIGFPYRPKTNVQRLPYLVCVLTFFQDLI